MGLLIEIRDDVKDTVWETIADVLQIIDKYRAESEVDNGNDD